MIGKVTVAIGSSGSDIGLGAMTSGGAGEDPEAACAMFLWVQLGCDGSGRMAGPVGNCSEIRGPLGGSRTGSAFLGPVGIVGEGSRILTSPSASVSGRGSSLALPFSRGCTSSVIITASSTGSAFTGDFGIGLALRLRVFCRGFTSASGSGTLTGVGDRSFFATGEGSFGGSLTDDLDRERLEVRRRGGVRLRVLLRVRLRLLRRGFSEASGRVRRGDPGLPIEWEPRRNLWLGEIGRDMLRDLP